MTIEKPTQAKRRAYHHGDLKQALLEAGVELARSGGPEAVALREVTRRAGVAPNAAYRHYASRHELLQAVRSAALSQLAMTIEAEMDKLQEGGDPAGFARASLRAVGTGYLKFAISEPGLFHAAFSIPDARRGEPSPEKAGNSGLNPFELLTLALDRMAEAGVLPKERRLGAEYLAWSAVHGLSMLVIDGPLRDMRPAEQQHVGQQLLEMVEKGLA